MKQILLLLSAALMFGLCGAEYKISNIKLTLAGKAHQEAFDELKKHLELTEKDPKAFVTISDTKATQNGYFGRHNRV